MRPRTHPSHPRLRLRPRPRPRPRPQPTCTCDIQFLAAPGYGVCSSKDWEEGSHVHVVSTTDTYKGEANGQCFNKHVAS